MKAMIVVVILVGASVVHAGLKITETDEKIIVEYTGVPEAPGANVTAPMGGTAAVKPDAVPSEAPVKQQSVANQKPEPARVDELPQAYQVQTPAPDRPLQRVAVPSGVSGGMKQQVKRVEMKKEMRGLWEMRQESLIGNGQ